MRNLAFEQQLAALREHSVGPLSWWRTLTFHEFGKGAAVVETAVASIAAVSRLAPPELIAEITLAVEEEKARVWNDLSMRYAAMDAMTLGLCWEIAGSCAALSAREMDPLGLVLLLKSLSEPYVSHDPDTRLFVASTWLGDRGSLLNQTSLSQIDWWQSERGFQGQALGEDAE